MGAANRFYRWMAQKRSRIDAPPVQQIIMGLKLFNRQLERQLKRMEKQEGNARAKADERRARGDKNGSYRLMKSALQYHKWLDTLKDFRFDLDDMNFQLTTAQDMGTYDQVGDALLKLLCEFKLKMGMPDIQRAMEELDLGYGNMVPVYMDYIKEHELQEQVVHISVSDEDVAEEFGEKPEKEEESAEESNDESDKGFMNLPSVPDEDKAKKDGSSEDDVFDLEAEIRRLRNQRKK